MRIRSTRAVLQIAVKVRHQAGDSVWPERGNSAGFA
jgi:hypothetical protein